jgi:hypothetical protein
MHEKGDRGGRFGECYTRLIERVRLGGDTRESPPRISPNGLCPFEAARKPSACTPPRILTNRIFLAPSCSAPAYRLRRNRTPSGKMLRKNRRAGFSIVLNLSFLIRGAGGRLRRGARRGGNILFSEAYICFKVVCWVWKPEKKPTANRREPQIRDLLSASGLRPSLESALRARKSDLLILTLASQLRCLARPFIGNVRANPVAAPAAPFRSKECF